MKSFLIFIFCISFIYSISFDEKRQILFSTIDSYIKAENREADTSVQNYISSRTKKDMNVYINAVNRYELGNRFIPENIYNHIQILQISSKPVGVHLLSYIPSSSLVQYEETFGAVMLYEDIIFYFLLQVDLKVFFTNGMEEREYEECTKTAFGKNCETKIKYVPKGVPDEDLPKIEKFIGYQSINVIKDYYNSILKLKGKILFTINQGFRYYTGSAIDSSQGMLFSDGLFVIGSACDINQLTSGDSCNRIRPQNQIIGTAADKFIQGDKMTIFISDDGYMYCYSLKAFTEFKTIWSKKIFEPNGELPYKFIISNDNDFLTYDNNYKLLGTLRNQYNFKNVDFAIPDNLYMANKDYTYFYGDGGFNKNCILKVTRQYFQEISRSWVWCYYPAMRHAYKDHGFTGYTVITKEGLIQHIDYEKENESVWQIKPSNVGTGPFRLQVSSEGELQAFNGDNELYWSSDTWSTRYLPKDINKNI